MLFSFFLTLRDSKLLACNLSVFLAFISVAGLVTIIVPFTEMGKFKINT